jgi:serine O-acetyltransferase
MTSAPSDFELDAVVAQLRGARDKWRARQGRDRELRGRELPSREVVRSITGLLSQSLFPMRLGPADLRTEGEDAFVGQTLQQALSALATQVSLELEYRRRRESVEHPAPTRTAEEIVQAFAAALPGVRETLDRDVEAAFHGDPAARSVDEVLLCYPGITAVIHHRLAALLFRLDAQLIARVMAQLAHADTGIDLHPGAQIGPAFFIDHGTGVVVGETAIIGANVRLYQAVTLGARRFPRDASGALVKGLPRHPIVEDDVVIYAGATILGRITIGRGSVIGGNVWLTHDVPAGSVVTQESLLAGPSAGSLKPAP